MYFFKYIVKDPCGATSLETIFKENAVERAKLPGYTLFVETVLAEES